MASSSMALIWSSFYLRGVVEWGGRASRKGGRNRRKGGADDESAGHVGHDVVALNAVARSVDCVGARILTSNAIQRIGNEVGGLTVNETGHYGSEIRISGACRLCRVTDGHRNRGRSDGDCAVDGVGLLTAGDRDGDRCGTIRHVAVVLREGDLITQDGSAYRRDVIGTIEHARIGSGGDGGEISLEVGGVGVGLAALAVIGSSGLLSVHLSNT